ncbi:hypothetical protein [Alteribacter natronophilus]|uniref:hypothetical protein n=1 Tax=Alteribacter natronophilus TaxID=2583810 RepID=UPI00110E8068|nr:hypothetical protein [Alteribacter natronophilus]TMW73365.1 hypothetical protein FGB90_03395 [Alteribacter natronophilus]
MKRARSSFDDAHLAVLKACAGKTLISVDARQITCFHSRSYGEDYNFFSPVILHFGKKDYLMFEPGEDENEDRVLTVASRNNPAPLNFETDEYGNHEKKDISGIMVFKTILNVTVYAFGNEEAEGVQTLDTAVLFDLEDHSSLCFSPVAYGTGLCVSESLIAQKLEHSYPRWSAR